MVLTLPPPHGVSVRPARNSDNRSLWARDPTGPDADNGTRLDATFVNDLIGLVRGLLGAYGIAANEGDDTALAQAVAAAIENHTHTVGELEDDASFVRMTVAERQKLAALVTNYKGAYASLALLEAAHPTASAGDWAVLSLPGEPASIAVWDSDAEPPAWVDVDNAPPQTASNLAFTPAGTLEATTVQAAIEELDSETQASLAVRLRADGAQNFTAQEVAQARANIGLGSGPLSGVRNKIINGDGRINQRGASSIGDDAYGHDLHYALTQAGNISVSTLTAPAAGVASMMRLTQSQASAQRMGYAQIIEAAETYGLRGKTVTLGGKLRYSDAAAVRFAVLEWTGPADAVTSDVVNDWASASYTAGGFFAGASLTVAAVGSVTPQANAITDWSITASLSTSANNLIVCFWTEGAAAQNATLDMRWYLVEGDATAEDDPFSPRHIQQELALCQRYYAKTLATIRFTASGASQIVDTHIHWPVPMRAAPTTTLTSTSTNLVSSSDLTDVTTIGARFSVTSSGAGDVRNLRAEITADAGL